MEMLVIIGAIMLWCVLFALCYWGGPVIIDRIYRKLNKSRGVGMEEAADEKKTFRIYVICFFVAIPLLSIATLFMKG